MSCDLSLRVPGTWSNGRVLKPEERKRKRQIDRATKRKAAENQKASEIRIQSLEQLVVELSGRIVNLETEIASTRRSRISVLDHAQIEPLVEPICPISWLPINTSLEANGLSQPLSVVGDSSIDLPWTAISENYSYIDATNAFMPFHTYGPMSSTLLSGIPTDPGSPAFPTLIGNNPAPPGSNPLSWKALTSSYAYAPNSSTLLSDIPPNRGSPIIQNLTRNIPAPQGLNPLSWEQTDKFEALISMLYSLRGTNLVDKDHFRNENILIRGIVVGWDSVLQEPYGKSCPLWAILSGIDKELFYNHSTIFRLAFLRKIYRMMMYIIYRTPVPLWLDPNSRPRSYNSQDLISVKNFIVQ